MKRLRLLILTLLLLGALVAFYYNRENQIHTETIQFKSQLVGKVLPYDIVLPPGYGLFSARRIRYPVIYLLHGWNSHYDSWLSRTALAQYASEHQLIIITPEGNNGWYTDSATISTDKYESYILQELIPDVDKRFRTVAERRGRAIAGFSMGGYGALKLGLKHPELFALVASISGALDATSRTDDGSIMQTFGALDSAERKSNDVLRLAEEFPAERIPLLPYFYLDCASDDQWLNINQRFAKILQDRKVPLEFRQLPGDHSWSYWDKQVQEVLRVASQMLLPSDST
jgi:putative tributyrin esterase